MLVIGTLLFAVVLVAALSHGSSNSTSSKCGTYRNDKAVQIKGAEINAEVPRTQAEYTKGLGGRECIDANRGMLFIFDRPSHPPFWMKDMNFAIDIVWISSEKKVIGLDSNLQPSSYPEPYTSAKPAQYVLELQAGRADSLHIDLGTPVSF